MSSPNGKSPAPTRFSAYTTALRSLSLRTGTPLPSLILSFGILHEITAIVPLVGIFYTSKALGIGEWVVQAVITKTDDVGLNDGVRSEDDRMKWGREGIRRWVEEGDKWAVKVGKKYGVFGYEKRKGGDGEENVGDGGGNDSGGVGHKIVGDVANAVVAYGVTKALLPVRIGVSMYFAPAFSRGVLDPARRAVVGVFRKAQP